MYGSQFSYREADLPLTAPLNLNTLHFYAGERIALQLG